MLTSPVNLTAQVIHPDGRVTTHKPTGKVWNFRELQALVGGGHFEVVPLPTDDGCIALCDEDGIAKDLPLNFTASVLLRQSVVGPVAVMLYDALRDENGE